MQSYLYLSRAIEWMTLGALFLGVSTTFYSLLSIREPRRRWKWYRFGVQNKSKFKRMLKRLLRVRKSPKSEALKQKLASCGIQLDAENYLLFKRAVLFAFLICLLVVILFRCMDWGTGESFASGLLFVLTIAGFVLVSDQLLLDLVKKHRSRRIVHEVYTLSRQILYYSGSRMNLHGKLMMCVPHARILRKELRMLLNEWYEDAGEALQRFKRRIGTDEGYSFVETLDVLRLNENEHYYELLKQRIRDYKEKMELYRESRKETTSYLLFVMAGIPILNTFRVFISPWVHEGQRLLEMLN